MLAPDVHHEVGGSFVVPDVVRCLSFDIWDTLLRGNKEFTYPRLSLIFELLGHPGMDAELLRIAYRASGRYFDSLSENTGLDYGFRERLQMMCAKLGIEASLPGDPALRAIQSRVGRLRLDPRYMPRLSEPDLIETLTALKAAGYRLGLLSNTGMDDVHVMRPVLERLSIWQLCELAIFSSEDGRAKPNPELFRHAVELFGVAPFEVLHIGDNTNADFRAREAGLVSVVYAPNGLRGRWFPSISSMKELLPREMVKNSAP